MAAVVASVNTATLDPASTNISCNAPSGTASGDLLVASLHVLGLQSVPTPSGWVPVKNVQDLNGGGILWTWTRSASGTSADNLSINLTSTIATLGIARITGADPNNPVNASGTAQPAASLTPAAATCTTTVANCLILRLDGEPHGNDTITAPSGTNQDWSFHGTTAVGSSQCLCDETQAAAGLTTARNFNQSASRTPSMITMGIAPALGGSSSVSSPSAFSSALPISFSSRASSQSPSSSPSAAVSSPGVSSSSAPSSLVPASSQAPSSAVAASSPKSSLSSAAPSSAGPSPSSAAPSSAAPASSPSPKPPSSAAPSSPAPVSSPSPKPAPSAVSSSSSPQPIQVKVGAIILDVVSYEQKTYDVGLYELITVDTAEYDQKQIDLRRYP